MNWLLIAVICIIAWNVVRGYTRGCLLYTSLMGHTESSGGRYATFVEAAIAVYDMEFDKNAPLWTNKGLLKCRIRQAVDTAHQYTFFCLIWVLDIFQSILQVCCRISSFRFHDIQDLCNRHTSSTSPNAVSYTHLIQYIFLVAKQNLLLFLIFQY